jgi:hypothetical protein
MILTLKKSIGEWGKLMILSSLSFFNVIFWSLRDLVFSSDLKTTQRFFTL